MRRFLGLGGASVVLAGSLALAGVLGGGARAESSGIRRQLGAGLSIVVPARWHVALRLTGLYEPYERFTLASFPVHRPAHAQSRCGPTEAVDAIPANGALAFVFEYGPHGVPRDLFPRQPKLFALPHGPPSQFECFGLGWILRFRVGARPFQIMIALGPQTGVNRGRLLRALSSLRVAG